MNAQQFKLATVIAKDTSIPLPWDLHDCLFGCGCADFVPVCVSIDAVASLLRYQCLMSSGGWDEREYQNCREILVGRGSRVTISDVFDSKHVRELVSAMVKRVEVTLTGEMEGEE